MTEKRPTPDQPAGKGRRKRAAPTIDLTATEIPPEVSQEASPVTSEADPPPPQASADPVTDVPPPKVEAALEVEPRLEAEPAFAPPPPEEPRKNAALTMPLVLAGVAGALSVSLVLAGLWLTGLLPGDGNGANVSTARIAGLEAQLQELQKRPAPVASGNAIDPKAIDALTQRVTKMEDSLTRIPAGDPALGERVTAADNALKSLGVALTALNKRSDDIAAGNTQARERAEAAEKAVSDLRASVQDVSKTANAGASSADLAPLQQRIVTLEQSARTASTGIAKATAADTAARRALSAGLLRDSVLRGTPFAAELAQAKALGADANTTSALEAFAAAGLPTRAALAQELKSMIATLRSVQAPPSGGFIERLQANAGQLVRIRPVDAAPGNDPTDVLARLEAAAARNDIPAAIVELEKLRRPELTDYERSPQYFWITKAQAREAAASAIQAYATETARSLGSK